MGELSRRQFLRRAGGGALSVGLGSQLGWLPGYGGARSPGAPNWEALDSRLRGTVVLPGHRDFTRFARALNRRYEHVRAAGVAVCEHADDVAASVRFARDSDLPIAVRSGGHNYAGYCAGRGLVIDLGRMRRISFDDVDGTMTVEPGARNTDVYRAMKPHGVAFSAGRCPTVAIGGLVLGGGIGFSSRKLGLTCDSLLAAEVVDAGGEHLRASDDRNADLFWGLRGAGGGNFAISTRFRFRTHPIGDVTLFDIAWKWNDAGAVMAALFEVIAGAPDELAARLGAGRPGDPATGRSGPPSFGVIGQYFGPEAELLALLDPALTVAKPTQSLVAERTFWQAKNYLYHTTPRGFWGTKSSYLRRPLSGDGIETLLRQIERLPGSRNEEGGGFAIFASGGAINRVAADATAFVHRDALALMATEVTWTAKDDERTIRKNLAWLDELAAAMRPHVSPFAYQNFIDRTQPNWKHAYYGANLKRLIKVKRAYDPDAVFSFKQSVPLGAKKDRANERGKTAL